MFAIAQRLSRLGVLWARTKDGLNQEEAKKLFFQFRKKSVLQGKNPEPSDPREPERTEVGAQMVTFMKETSEKLDRIETDIEHLKQQVDKILKKI